MQPGGGQPPFPPAAQPAGTAAAAAQAPQQATAHTVEPAGAPYSRDGVPTSSTNAAGVPALQLAQLTQQQQQPYQGMPPPPPRRTSGVDQAAIGQLEGHPGQTLPQIKVVSPREQQHQQQQLHHAAAAPTPRNAVAATPRSVFSYATHDLSDVSEGDEDDEGGNTFGKRKIKRTLTRLQRQQRIIDAQNAALLQHQQMMAAAGGVDPTPYDTPEGSPHAQDTQAAAAAAGGMLPGQQLRPSPPRLEGNSDSQQQAVPLQGNSGGFGGKDVGVCPGQGGKGGPDSAFAAAALAAMAATAAKSAATGGGLLCGNKDPNRAQAELADDLTLLQELMGDSVQGADLSKRMPWWDMKEVRLYILGFAAALIITPIILGGMLAASLNRVDVEQLYRLLVFFAGWPFIWLAVNVCVWRMFIVLERLYYKQALCYHGKLRRATTFLVWTCLLLGWFYASAWIVPCPPEHAKCRYNLVYTKARIAETVKRFSLCACLFSIALFITSVLGRLLGRHFYNTAHYTKVANVLWKQYWLVMLAQPRSKLAGKDKLCGAFGDDDDDSVNSCHGRGRTGHSLRHRKGHKDDTAGKAKHGWPAAKVVIQTLKPTGDQLLPTHTTATAAGGGASGAGAAHMGNGKDEPSFRSVSLSAGMGWGSDAAEKQRGDQQRMSRLRKKMLRRQHEQHQQQQQQQQQQQLGGSSSGWFGSWRGGWKGGSASHLEAMPGVQQHDFGDDAALALQKAADLRVAIEESEELPDDPLLDAGVLRTLNVKLEGKPLAAQKFRAGAWERVREGIGIQTYEVLLGRYRGSKDEEEKQLQAARRLGKALFQHVKGDPTRTHIMREDFDPFFAGLPNAEAEANAAFFFFDKENNAMIGQHEMVNKVVEIVQERQDMASSLRDTNSIVSTLEFGIGMALNIVFLLMYLAVWKIDVAKGFSTVTASLMFFSFMFSNSAKNVFESTLFLLVAHSFDVGDLLDIEGVMYRVRKITLLYSTLVKSSGEISLYPNAKLLAAPLINLSRGSCLQNDKVVIHVDTGEAGNVAYEALAAAMAEHFEEQERHFNSVPLVRFTGIINPFKAEITISWTYNFGPSEPGRAKKVKSALLRVVQTTLGQLPEMLAAEHNHHGNGSAAGQSGEGDDANAHMRAEQERVLMNTAVMGNIAVTDTNDAGGGGDGFFMA